VPKIFLQQKPIVIWNRAAGISTIGVSGRQYCRRIFACARKILFERIYAERMRPNRYDPPWLSRCHEPWELIMKLVLGQQGLYTMLLWLVLW